MVVNGVGHDDFIFDMIKASGNDKLRIIRPNDGVPLLKAVNGGTVNSHTFISFSKCHPADVRDRQGAVGAAARPREPVQPERGRLCPPSAGHQGEGGAAALDARVNRIVTVHDGYDYLMQEFGIDIAGVVEPAHGLLPSAKELGEMVQLLQRERIPVVFSEESFPACES